MIIIIQSNLPKEATQTVKIFSGVVNGRWLLTRIELQGVSSEKKSQHIDLCFGSEFFAAEISFLTGLYNYSR